MKTPVIHLRHTLFLALALFGVVMTVPRVWPQDDFKLKAGAKGELCLKCHEAFQKTIQRRYLHPLLKTGDCTGCHATHTTDHAGLLTANITTLCRSCHQAVLPEKPVSAHNFVAAGDCKKCHDSHGSDRQYILVKSGNELCVDCHKEVGDIVANAVFKHAPTRKDKGCLNCHVPHASADQNFLLKNKVPSLCKTCHKTGQPAFIQKHLNYPVADSDCISCHDPHGSDRRGILFANAHTPVRDKKCAECHESPDSPRALETKKPGVDSCRQCHNDMISLTLDKNRLHWPLVDRRGCLNCHNPHGARQKKLLRGTISGVCGKCHADTLELQNWSINNPKNEKLCNPVKTGNCIACHSPHAADNILLMNQASVSIELCGGCHEWLTHSTHPIGPEVIDQRNKNVSVECVSCHRACGTGNKPAMLHFAATRELCIQCHIERTR